MAAAYGIAVPLPDRTLTTGNGLVDDTLKKIEQSDAVIGLVTRSAQVATVNLVNLELRAAEQKGKPIIRLVEINVPVQGLPEGRIVYFNPLIPNAHEPALVSQGNATDSRKNRPAFELDERCRSDQRSRALLRQAGKDRLSYEGNRAQKISRRSRNFFATILRQNEDRGDEDCSVLCTTYKAETRFGFSYLQFTGLYSKFPELAFNQWVVGSSPTRLINKTTKTNYFQAARDSRFSCFMTILRQFAALI